MITKVEVEYSRQKLVDEEVKIVESIIDAKIREVIMNGREDYVDVRLGGYCNPRDEAAEGMLRQDVIDLVLEKYTKAGWYVVSTTSRTGGFNDVRISLKK